MPSGSARGEKIRKTEATKTESMPRMMPQHFEAPIGLKQPIETNTDSVKSLLKEFFAASLTNSILLNGESYKLKLNFPLIEYDLNL